MEYYYDIELSFADYPIPCYDWDSKEKLLKIGIIRVENIKEILEYQVSIDIPDGKYILSDGINAIAVEVIDKKTPYLSYLKYDDENYVIRIVSKMKVGNYPMQYDKKRAIDNDLRIDSKIKKVLLSLVNEASDNLIKYIYYDVTDTYSDNIDRIKKFLKEDIKNNFNQKYINLYENICK